jgi:hypothetical protein
MLVPDEALKRTEFSMLEAKTIEMTRASLSRRVKLLTILQTGDASRHSPQHNRAQVTVFLALRAGVTGFRDPV